MIKLIYRNIDNGNGNNIGIWNFIPEYTLTAHITKFNYEYYDIFDYIDEYSLIPTIFINNTSSANIKHDIKQEEKFSAKIKWQFNQNFDIFQKVKLVKRLPNFSGTNSSLSSFNGKLSLRQLESENSSDPSVKSYVYECQYMIEAKAEITANSVIEIDTYYYFAQDIEINFTGLAQISGKHKTGDPLSGNQIHGILASNQSFKFTIIEVNDWSVIIFVDGVLEGSFCFNHYFDINNI